MIAFEYELRLLERSLAFPEISDEAAERNRRRIAELRRLLGLDALAEGLGR